jgi:hypothetical protein
MIHLTLNTGHSHEVPPGKVERSTIRILGSMVVKGGDIIPLFAPWRTIISFGNGCACFDIRRNREDMVTFNAVAWTPAGAEEAWAGIEKLHLDNASQLAHLGLLHPDMSACPEIPETLPWLTTLILPAMHIANPKDLGWMADFEQCLAATIIHKRNKTP